MILSRLAEHIILQQWKTDKCNGNFLKFLRSSKGNQILGIFASREFVYESNRYIQKSCLRT